MLEARDQAPKNYHISSRQILRELIAMVKKEQSIEDSPVFGVSEDPKGVVLRKLAYHHPEVEGGKVAYLTGKFKEQ
jgi:hypothetical protein